MYLCKIFIDRFKHDNYLHEILIMENSDIFYNTLEIFVYKIEILPNLYFLQCKYFQMVYLHEVI